MNFHGGACCCWDWLGLLFLFFNLSRLVLRSPRLVVRSPPGMSQSGARLVLPVSPWDEPDQGDPTYGGLRIGHYS